MKFSKMAASAIICFSAYFAVGGTNGLAKTVTLTPGVQWDSNQSVVAKKNQFINMLQLNMNDPYTSVEIGMSPVLEQKNTVTALSKLHTRENHHVVGAVNASIYHVTSGIPAYLLAVDHKIVNLGRDFEPSNSFMSVPAAFGVMKDNTAKIGRFNITISASYNNQSMKVDSFNNIREDHALNLYTSSYKEDYTKTNPYGHEIVVTGLNKKIDKEASFGETVTGKISAIRSYGTKSSAKIPKDGFVLSASGTKADALKNMKVGDSISVTVDIDQQWKDAKFILANGPLLVQNGKANMTIAYNSGKALQRTSRTAIAIDKTGKKVFMVTVDSKKKGKSEGMTMQEFANYLVSKGAYQAINMDGGGSTTMAARIPGDRYASLVNWPADGSQRRISNTLEVISSAPYSEPVKITVAQNGESNLLAGSSTSFTVTSALDAYNNLTQASFIKPEYSVEGNIGRMEGNTFIAERSGSGYVVITSGKAVVKKPISVEAQPANMSANVASLQIANGKTQKMSVTAYGKNGKAMQYSPSALTWSVTGNIGTIQADGTFTASATDATGSIIADINGKKLSIPVTVSNKPAVVSSLDNVKEWKASSTRAATSLIGNNSSIRKEGKGYIGIQYDFRKYKANVSASYMSPVKKLTVPGNPSSLSLWVWGDAKNHWLRGKVKDSKGKEYTIDFTKEHMLNWKSAWKQTTAILPKGISYPISIQSIYIAEGNATNKTNGVVYLDALTANYK
ncbi:phosphodiester glycosidase family protein [Bacillus testis]|uniref:phosphodiester glycosidase family protein n=1 Tax=Bacillus testis TaxID=1622072 RepID=UPI00067F57BE|nr:phosphodiester glycosidase family protein [Bacillus testis]